MLAKHVLYQLSYTPKRKKPVWWAGLVGTGRVELPTSTLSVWRSNQLSYRTISLSLGPVGERTSLPSFFLCLLLPYI